MGSRSGMLLALLIAHQGAIVEAGQPDAVERVLNNRLNNLESQAVQRQGRERRPQDLLTRQDNRIAGQTLNTLKTRRVRSATVPFLERKLSRSRRAVRALDRR